MTLLDSNIEEKSFSSGDSSSIIYSGNSRNRSFLGVVLTPIETTRPQVKK